MEVVSSHFWDDFELTETEEGLVVMKAKDGTSSADETMAAHTLVVEVVNAVGLMPMDGQGTSSACVEVDFDGQQFCTAVMEEDLNPVWNERFYFNVSDPSNFHNLALEACVFNVQESNYNSKSFLGRVQIPGASITHLSDDVIYHYYKLENPSLLSSFSGELCLKVYTLNETSIIDLKHTLPAMDHVISSYILQLEEDQSPRLVLEEKDRSPRPRDIPLVQVEDPCARPFDVASVHPRPRIIPLVQVEDPCPRPCDAAFVQEEDQGTGPRIIPFVQLKEITNNFSDERVLGHGGFGVVYKGVLQNGEMIAVKRIMSILKPGQQKLFLNEVSHLMMLKHPNIVRCVDYCYETRHECVEYNGEYVFAEMAERFLCLEYMPNGSLDKYLSDESSGLDWRTRYKIIVGICYGLCHLHEQNDKPINHLDLKPANILLDDSLVPKITDFGLSRQLEQQTVYTSSCVGTLGYMAPEFLGGTITPKSDIFSLGVIIIEIITGHKDYPGVTGTSSDVFIELVLKNWRNVLEKSPGYGSLEMDCRQIKRCMQVGLICVNPDRIKRPPIAKIVSMIQGLESIDCETSNEAA